MQGKVHPVAVTVGFGDGVNNRSVWVVSHKLDSAGSQVRLHRIGDSVHPEFFASVGDIGVILLRGGTQVNFWQDKHPFIVFPQNMMGAEKG